MRGWIRVGFVLWLAGACSRDGNEGSDTDPEVPADRGSDADTPTNPPDCEADYLAGTPVPGSAGACLTEEVFCGDVLYQTTEGGDTLYDDGFWERNFLSSTLEAGDLDGPERVYVFRGLTFDQTVTFTVDSCGEMWGSTLLYGDVSGEACDYDDPLIQGQHMIGAGTGLNVGTRINGSYSASYDIVVIVDGFQDTVGNFTLTVGCGEQ